MSPETRTCQNCKQNFTIESEDFDFYKKIDVPAPTWCPECRMQRRMLFRNERTIYKRVCDLCGKNKISIYNKESQYKVYCRDCFYGDAWNQLDSGHEYDFSKPFFQQYLELTFRAPKLGLQVSHDVVNSEYCNHYAGVKNCYLIFAGVNDEDCMYCNYVSDSKNIVDCLRVSKSEICFESLDCHNCNRLMFSQQCQDSFDASFLYNCKGCSNCFMCSNLVRKSYCIRNEQYPKGEYEKIVSKYNLGSRSLIKDLSNEFGELKKNTLRRSIEGFNHINSTGNYLTNTKNCKDCFDLSSGEDCRFVIYGNDAKDIMDAYAVYPKATLCYETVGAGAPAYNAKFCYLPWTGSNLTYCINALSNCHNCFGCNHIHDVQYCILNKQYSKEEYEALIPKIRKHMDDMPYVDGRGVVYKYGEYFPPNISPFAYNETIAQQYIPLTKEKAISSGYAWFDDSSRDYEITKKQKDVPDNITEVSDEILNDVVECAHNKACVHQCTGVFKIVSAELQFYRRFNLPLPRLCPNCRHYERLKQRNPLKLWHRKCQCVGKTSENGVYTNTSRHQHGEESCPNEFETSYAPERPEIVYCEQCYQAEVM